MKNIINCINIAKINIKQTIFEKYKLNIKIRGI